MVRVEWRDCGEGGAYWYVGKMSFSGKPGLD